MKKVFAIFLCGAVLFNTVGFIVLFSASIFEWKKIVADELEKKNDTELIKIIDNSSVQHLNNHEIIVSGKLYDIAHKTKVNGSIILYCSHDYNEEQINTQLLNGLQQNTDSPAAQNNKPVKSHNKQLLTEYLPQEKVDLANVTLLLSYIKCYDFSVVSEAEISIQLPPPRS